MLELPSDMKAVFKEAKTLVKYRSLKIQGECLGRILGRIRIDCHIDMVKHIDFKTIIDEAEKKTVIFSSYIEVCEETLKSLEKDKRKPAKVYGQYTKQLSQTVNTFMTVDDVNPFIATYASLSTAVPLIVANTMILINSPFRAYIQEQAISRIHRLGADTAIFVYECSLDTGDNPNISTRGIDILKWSQDMVKAITGTDSIFETGDIVETVDGLNISTENYDVDVYEARVNPVMEKSIFNEW
jgi:hypothetical protein